MKKLTTWTLAATVVFAALACETSTTPDDALTTPNAAMPLGAWELQSFETPGEVVPVPDSTKYTIELGDDGNDHVVADCNLCNGSYELQGTSLTLGLMACTLAACSLDSFHYEYLQALGSVTAWQRSGSALVLTYDGGAMRFQMP